MVPVDPDAEEARCRAIVESAGAVFVGIRHSSRYGDVVLFRAKPGEITLCLYVAACKSVEDIRLAVKSKYEEVRTFGDLS